MMKKTLLAAAALCALTSGAAMAQNYPQDGKWMVRARAVQLDSANKDSTPLDLSINDKVIPELDISYFFTPNFAAELILTYPQKHDLRAGGTKIGSLKHLPPLCWPNTTSPTWALSSLMWALVSTTPASPA